MMVCLCRLLLMSKFTRFLGDQTDPKSACGGPNSILRTGGALFISSIGSRHTLMILAISSRLWGVRLYRLFFCCFFLWLIGIKRSQVISMRKFRPRALNFGQDFGLQHHSVFNFLGTPCTSIYDTEYTGVVYISRNHFCWFQEYCNHLGLPPM